MKDNIIEALIVANPNKFKIITALSDFIYKLENKNDKWVISYNGSYKGLGSQNVLPECIKHFDWINSTVDSSMGLMSYLEYVEFRLNIDKVRGNIYSKYWNNKKQIIQITESQIKEEFKKFRPLDWNVRIVNEDENEIVFEIDKITENIVTPFTIKISS
jgi:hypothetical protein